MKTFIILITLIISIVSFGQKDFFKNWSKDLTLGLNSNFNLTTGEVGVSFIKEKEFTITNNIIISAEIGEKKTDLLIAPKLTYCYNYKLFNGSLSILNYNYGQSHTLNLKPQIGITIFGYADLVYGYNIPLLKNNHEFKGSMLTFRWRFFDMKNILNLV